MYKYCIAFLLLLFPVLCPGKRITVRSQEDFDRLQENADMVSSSEDTLLEIRISPGQYFFDENHLLFAGIDRADLRVRIMAAGATLTARSTGDDYALEKGYVDLDSQDPKDIREPVCQAGSWPIPDLRNKGVYLIRCQEPDRSEEEVAGWHIILSQWFKGAVYPVVKIRNGWLFFRKDRDYGTGMWSELRFGRCLPRYILCHPPARKDLHPCGVSNFLTVKDCRFRSILLEGLTFLGNKEGDSLIRADRVSAGEVVISGCRFWGIKSDVIVSEESDGLVVKDCQFRKNYLSCIRVGEGGANVRILHNRFLDNGLMMSNAPVVLCQAKEYLVEKNYFEDFSYSAIRVGLHFTQPNRFGTSGIVADNEICMSADFRRGVPRVLIDGGAIYVSTFNTKTIIRDNLIHDIEGPHGNRGILADDGPVNVEICGNRIFHIRNGHCIDLRRCFRVARKPGSQVARPNMGNKIHDNVCDGRMRLYVRKNDPTSCITGNTIL